MPVPVQRLFDAPFIVAYVWTLFVIVACCMPHVASRMCVNIGIFWIYLLFTYYFTLCWKNSVHNWGFLWCCWLLALCIWTLQPLLIKILQPLLTNITYIFTFSNLVLLTPAPKAGVIVVACAVRAAAAVAGINLVGVPQTKPMQWFFPNFQDMSITKGSRAD